MNIGSILLISVMMTGMLLGIPISWSMILASLSAILVEGIPLAMLAQKLFTSVDNFPMLAVPCFLVAGDIMAMGSISNRLVGFCSSIFGSLRGGLAIVALVACSVFAALTGSAIATTAAIGGILYPAMTEKKYPKAYTSAVLAIGGTLGPVIPPSGVFIFYSMSTGLSIVKLFMSGMGPGIVSCIVMALLALFIAGKRNMPREGNFSFRNVLQQTKRAGFALFMPIIILGGIYLGVFSATESAAVAVIYGIIVSVFIYRDVTLKDLVALFLKTARSTANLLILIAAANLFGYLISYFGVPKMVTNIMMQYVSNKFMFMLVCGIMLLIAGMFMEAVAITVILAPILHPIAINFGIDPIHFASFMVFVLCVGFATPPFAPTLFVVSGMSKEPVFTIAKELFPFILIQILVAALVAAMPFLSTWLPNTL